MKLVAICVLGEIAEIGCQLTVAALNALLAHNDRRVRKSAVEILGQLAGRNDRLIVGALVETLEDPDAGVRNFAIGALVKAVEKGDFQTIEALRAYLGHSVNFVRSAGMQ